LRSIVDRICRKEHVATAPTAAGLLTDILLGNHSRLG
jgi:hypothetical protein